MHRPDDVVLSEESADDLARLDADRVWIIDPLDGTREFALRGREITAAAVAQPALGAVYSTDGTPPAARADGLRILVSDSRPRPSPRRRPRRRAAAVGSAGATAMAVLCGDADAYLHAGGQ